MTPRTIYTAARVAGSIYKIVLSAVMTGVLIKAVFKTNSKKSREG